MFQFLKIFKKLKAASKLKKLWQNYTKVAGLESNAVKSQKLIEFLKNLELQFRRMSPKDLQHIFQNFQEFMEVIQEVIKQAALENDEEGEQGVQHELSSFLNSILVTAEKVVNNPKYRADFQKSSGILKNIVSLLERVKSHETKTIIVRIIKILSESSENQQLLGELEGYKKLFQLIQDPDPGIRGEIIKFLKHFVDISDIEENSSEPQQRLVQKIFKIFKGVLTNFSERLQKKEELEEIMGENQENKASSSSISHSTEELSGLFRFNSTTPLQEFPPTISTLKEWERALETHWRQIPNFNFREVQKFCFEEVSEELKDQRLEAINCAKFLNFGKAEVEEEVKASPKKKGKKEEQIANKVVLDIFRLQGVLKEIIGAFMEHEGTSQLELMKIIAKMLNQPENEEEFKARGGYSAVNIFFDTYRDYKQPNQQKFLSSAFSILEKIIFNSPSTETGLIENIEAFKVLLKILLDGTNYVVVSKAFYTLQRILHMHPYNSLVLMKTKHGFERIFISLIRVLIEDDKRRAEIISQIYPQVTANSVCLSKVGNMERSNDISQGLSLVPLTESQKLEYLQQVDEQMSFMASMLNDSANITPFRLYSFLIRKGPKYLSTVAMELVIESMVKFVNDKLQRATYNRLEEGSFSVEQVNILIEDISLRFMKEAMKENKETYFESSYLILCKLFLLKEQLLSCDYLQSTQSKLKGDELIVGEEESEENKEGSSMHQTEEKLTTLVVTELEKDMHAIEGKFMMLAELIAKTTESHCIRLTIICSLLRLATQEKASLTCCSVMESIFKAGKQREFHQYWIIFETNEVSLLVKEYCAQSSESSQILNLMELIFLFTFNNCEAKERIDTFFKPAELLEISKNASLDFEEPQIKLLIEKALDLAIETSFVHSQLEEYSCPIMREERQRLKETGPPLFKLPLSKSSSNINRSIRNEQEILIPSSAFLDNEPQHKCMETIPKLRSSFWIDYLLNLSYTIPDRFSVYVLDRLIELLRDDANQEKLLLLQKIEIFLEQYRDHHQNMPIKQAYSSLIIEILRHGVSSQSTLPLKFLLSDQNFRIPITELLQKNSSRLYFKIEPRQNLQTYEYIQIPSLPPKKLGFTIMGWVEISHRNKVNPVLSLMENNLDLFELIYLFNEQERRNNRSSIESVNDQEIHKKSSSVFTLQARIRQNKPLKFPLSQQDFRPGYFAHIGFIVSKNVRQLWVNGREIKEEDYKTEETKSDFVYPFKEKNMKLIIEQDQLKRYAGLTIFEGALLPYQIHRIYECGPSGSIADFKEKSEIQFQKVLFRFPKIAKWIPKIPPSITQEEQYQMPHVVYVVKERFKELEMLDPPKRSSFGIESPGAQSDINYQSLEVFQTYTLKEYLTSPGSIRQILKFMILNKTVRLSQKLYLLRGILIQNNSAYQTFVELKGIKILYRLFEQECFLFQLQSTEFAYLFDILCDFTDAHRKLVVNITKQPQDRIPLISLKRKAILRLITDALFLVRDCDSFSKGLDFLHTLTDHPLNREIFKELGGIKILLSLLKHICEVQYDDEESFIMKVFHKVIRIIENYFSRFSQLKEDAEFEALLGFIISNENHVHKPKFKQSVIDLLSILSVHLLCDSQQQAYYQQKLMHFDVLAFVTTLIQFNKREITLFALKILAAFLHSQTKEAKKFKSEYYKIKGPDIIQRSLENSDPMRLRSVISFLPIIAQENSLHPNMFYPQETKDRISQVLYESIGSEIQKRCDMLRLVQAGGSRIKLIEFIKMYFKLLPKIPNYFLAQYKCHAIAAINSPLLMQSLLDQERYFAMAYEALQEVKANFDTEIGNRIEGDLISYLCDFTRFDLSSPNSKFLKLMRSIPCDLSFYEKFLTQMNEELLRDEIKDPPRFLKNYSHFFFNFEYIHTSPLILISTMRFIKNLPNSESIQKKELIKENKLPNLRDIFILSIFKMSPNKELIEEEYFMNALSIVASFKSITQEAIKQKDQLWQLYLLRFMVQTKHEQFRLEILTRLREDIWTIEDNKKQLISFVKSAEITDILLSKKGKQQLSQQQEKKENQFSQADTVLEILKHDLVDKIEKKTTTMSAKYLQSLDELKAKKKQQVKENVQSSQEKSGQLKKFFTQFEGSRTKSLSGNKVGILNEFSKIEMMRKQNLAQGEKETHKFELLQDRTKSSSSIQEK